jgi:hypothetical protein
MAYCQEGLTCNQQQLVAKDATLAREVVFMAPGKLLKQVTVFQYLGHPLSSMGDDWLAIYRNLTKACKC